MPGELLSIVAPIYVAIGLGWGWGRVGRRWDMELITELIMTIGAPCLVFSSLVGMKVDPAALLQMVGATLAAFASFALIGALVLRLAGLPVATFLGAPGVPERRQHGPAGVLLRLR